jgi:hypothetical protein
MVRMTQNERYMSALRRAEEAGGESPDTVLQRENVSLQISDTVFAVVNTGSRPNVETIAIDQEINVRLIVPSTLTKVGRAHVLRSVGGMPSQEDIYLDHRNVFWWNYDRVPGGTALDVIREEVLEYLDDAAEKKAWVGHGEKPHLGIDFYAENYLQDLPNAFSGLYAVTSNRREVYLGSHQPGYVITVEKHAIRSVLVDTMRQDMPDYPADMPATWVDALLRFELIEIEQMKDIMAAIDRAEPHRMAVTNWDILDLDVTMPTAVQRLGAGNLCWKAERAMFLTLGRETKLFSTAAIRALCKKTPEFGRFDDKKRAPRAPFFHQLEALLMENEQAYREACDALGWPLRLNPVKLIAMRYEALDRQAETFHSSKLAKAL